MARIVQKVNDKKFDVFDGDTKTHTVEKVTNRLLQYGVCDTEYGACDGAVPEICDIVYYGTEAERDNAFQCALANYSTNAWD